MFYLWLRLGRVGQRHLWRLYGWYSSLMLGGSCVGILTWSARIKEYESLFQALALPVDHPRFSSLFLRHVLWHVVFIAAYSIEFFCLSVAYSIVLDRMTDNLWKRWVVGGRFVTTIVVAGAVVGVVSSFVAASELSKFSDSATNHSSTNLQSTLEYLNSPRYAIISSFQDASEATVLPLIAVAYTAVGIASTRRITSSLRTSVSSHVSETATGRSLVVRILGTTACVVAALLLRSVYSFMFAFGMWYYENSCDASSEHVIESLCDPQCYNTSALMLHWMILAPAFESIVILLSSPVAMLVVMWGMTGKKALEVMKSARWETIASRQELLTT
jgi:uncharacterized membrane protein